MNTDINVLLNQFNVAVQDDLRFVVRTEGGIEYIETRLPSGRLDARYTADYNAVADRIVAFCRNNRYEIHRPQLTTFVTTIQNKATQIQSQRIGFFNCIILFFLRCRKTRLTNEYHFYSRINTNLQTLLGEQIVPLRVDPVVIPAMHPIPQPAPNILPQTPTSTLLSVSEPINPQPSPVPPTPELTETPPPPGCPPPLPLPPGCPPPPSPPPPRQPSTPITNLFPSLVIKLPNEPEVPFLPRNELTPEQIQTAQNYINAMKDFLRPLEDQNNAFVKLNSEFTENERTIRNLQQEINRCETLIQYLSNDPGEDFITVNLTLGKNVVSLNVLTARAYQEIVDSIPATPKPTRSQPQTSIDSSPAKTNQSRLPQTLTPPSSPVSVSELRTQFQSPSSSNHSRPATFPRSSSAIMQKKDYEILNAPFIIQVLRRQIETFQLELNCIEEQNRQLTAQITTTQTTNPPNLDQLVNLKKTHIEDCERRLRTQQRNSPVKTLPNRSNASVSSPNLNLPTEHLSRREQLLRGLASTLEIPNPKDRQALGFALQPTKAKPTELIVGDEFSKSFIGKMTIPS